MKQSAMALLLRCVAIMTVMVAFFGVADTATAQVGGGITIKPGPSKTLIDGNGVDLVSGTLAVLSPKVAIGSATSGLQHDASSLGFPYHSNFNGSLNGLGGNVRVALGEGTETYSSQGGGVYLPILGAQNTFSCTGTICTYTLKDGTQALYDTTMTADYGLQNDSGLVTKIIKPSGEIITISYTYAYRPAAEPHITAATTRNLQSVSSSMGWMVKYTISPNIQHIEALNTSVDYCDPTALGCAGASQAWVNSSYGTTTPAGLGITNDLGQTTTYFGSGLSQYQPTSIKLPSGVTKTITWTGTNGKVTSVSLGTSTWTYAFTTVGTLQTATVTNPDGSTHSVVSDTTTARVVSATDEIGRTTKYLYNASGWPSRVIRPDATYSGTTVTGGYTDYAYDTRGNLTTTTVVAKAGSGLANIVATSNYPLTCTNLMTCNQPSSTVSPNGVVTDFTYDAVTGKVLTVTHPAIAGVQAQTRYSYSLFTPYVKNSAGSLVASTPVWQLTGISQCLNGSAPSCVGTTDEVKTVVTYGTNNIQPVTMTTELGNNTNAKTTTFTYDNFGNITSEDGPIIGSDDTTYTFYDALNRRVGLIGPDPDGGGPLLRKAQRTTYNVDGQETIVERGTTSGTNLAALTAMTVRDKAVTDYDAVTDATVAQKYYDSAGVLRDLTQTTYDSSLRVSCVAKRLNPSVFGSTPASACTLGTAGTDGPDQIVKYSYDATGAVLKATSALGTAQQTDALTKTYSAANGTVTTMIDGKGNLTTLTYDGFNRLIKACLPSAANGAVSSTTDCEQSVFTGPRVTSVVMRDGQTIAATYDAMGRLSGKSGAGITESFAYNNFGQTKSHTNNGNTETYTYNALGQLLSDAQPMGTVTYDYDAYGRRSKMTYPSSGGIPFSVAYTYRNDDSFASEQVIYNSGAAIIQAQFAEDSFGRMTAVSNGPATPLVTTFGFDTAARLSSVTINVNGTVNDNTASLTYSTANQIKQVTNSNGAFDYAVPAAQTTNYTFNGLNQAATANAVTLGYDGRGNLNSDGNVTYTYNANNLLTGTSSGAVMTYDAENRLLSVAKSGATTQFLYDGTDIIAEYNGAGGLLRRYVQGPGTDQPVVWYEGTDVSQPRYLAADQQGSVIAVTDGLGNALAINTYDAYGLPKAGNLGRFQYTGQVYLSEIGLYYYKARLYSPSLQRFFQPDPVGYGDGMNIYAYVHGDPVGGNDPWGLTDDDDTTVVVVVGVRRSLERMFPLMIPPTIEIGNNLLKQMDDVTTVVVHGKKKTKDKPEPEKKPCTCFDTQKFADHLDDAAPKGKGSGGECATFVRQAVTAGGLDTSARPPTRPEGKKPWAADYGPYVEKWGFDVVSDDGYVAEQGDIIVYGVGGGHKYGHMEGYDGTQWVSDFRQLTDMPNSSDDPNALGTKTIYRAKCKC